MHHEKNCAHHAPTSFGTAFAIGIVLNGLFVLAELAFGFASHSLALLADAGHNFGDVLGLLLAWIAAGLALRPRTQKLTYGYRRSSILAALANSCILLMGVGAIVLDSILRLLHPAPVAGWTVTVVAAIGICVNGVTALLFARGRHGELNVRSAYLHMLADAVIAAGVVVAGLAIRFTGFAWIDPITGLMIAALIARSSWAVLREAADLAMDAVPKGVDAGRVLEFLRDLPGVSDVSDLHIWAISTTENALTARILAPLGLSDAEMRSVETNLAERFLISHCTIQTERTPGPGCALSAE